MEETTMEFITKLWVKARESKHGQTMTEYVLIIAAVALAGYLAYEGLANSITTEIGKVSTALGG
jgi:Flp pilus assembly pilin Flp